jgi:hypothetical protein
MSKPSKAKNEAAAGAPAKIKDPKKLAKEWGKKIKENKETLEQGKKSLAEIIIPYFDKVQSGIASEDLSFDVLEVKEQKPVRAHFRLGDGRVAELSVTSEGLILERSDQPKERIVKIGVKDPAQIQKITEFITAFMDGKAWKHKA